MTFELDTLIAIAFLAPVAFFALADIVQLRSRGPASVTRFIAAESAEVTAAASREAANDEQFRQAA